LPDVPGDPGDCRSDPRPAVIAARRLRGRDGRRHDRGRADRRARALAPAQRRTVCRGAAVPERRRRRARGGGQRMTELGKAGELPLSVDARLGDRLFAPRNIAIVVVVSAVTAVIAFTAGGFWLSNFTQAYCSVLALMGCALLYGQLGLVSLCQW